MTTLGRYSTADAATGGVDLTNKVVIITGANSGIGYEAAIAIAKRNATLIVACRDSDKTRKAVEGIKVASGNPNVRSISIDLSSFKSVRSFVDEFNRSTNNGPLHVLLNNAGVMATPYGKTEDGYETQFGTNHLGHFLLTNLLVPNLKAGSPSRVVNLSSMAHRYGGVNFDDYNFDHTKYDAWKSYGQSKSANILFSIEFAKRFAAHGITANACHPGVIGTDLTRHMGFPGVSFFFRLGTFFGFTKTPTQGASTGVMLAVNPSVTTSGKYYSDCKEDTPKPFASDPELANRLWELSEKLVGL